MKIQVIFMRMLISLVFVMPGWLQAEVKPLPAIKISTPKDTADVKAVNDDLGALTSKVTACVNAGGKPETCQCSEPALLKNLRGRYSAIITQHPGWKDHLLSYEYQGADGRLISGILGMPALGRQLEIIKCE